MTFSLPPSLRSFASLSTFTLLFLATVAPAPGQTAPARQEGWKVEGTVRAQGGVAVDSQAVCGRDCDLRWSDMGPDGDPLFSATNAAVAYNPVDDELLVVWVGEEADDEFEIYGQRIDAATGAEVGVNDFRISDMGLDGVTSAAAADPVVAYNPALHEYLVVWVGDQAEPPVVNGELEVYGQRIDAATGGEVGVNDFRISDMGPDGDPLFDAFDPVVVHNRARDEYLVVWSGEEVDGELEIWGQRLDNMGVEIGANDFRVSSMGPDGDPDFDAQDPAAGWSSLLDQYLVVWSADDDQAPQINAEFEIHGQLLDGMGVEIGVDDFRISSMGPDGNTAYDALHPALATNPDDGSWLVVWSADDDTAPRVDGEFEIHGQLLDSAGAEIGADDFPISSMGPDGDAAWPAATPAVVWIPIRSEYLVVWSGQDDIAPLVAGENEVFGQRLDSAGAAIGADDFRLSDAGVDGETTASAVSPSLAWSAASRRAIAVWQADDTGAGLADDEVEIFGRVFPPLLFH